MMNIEIKKKRQSNRPALILDCAFCGTKVRKLQSQLQKRPFCNASCAGKFYAKTNPQSQSQQKGYPCAYCDKIIFRKPSDLYYRGDSYGKPKQNFCSKICLGNYLYFNKIGIHDPNHIHELSSGGGIRSQLEFHIEEKFLEYFPYISIYSNDRIICAPYELDFYIPDLKLAIEINGIHHFKPIFGQEHLDLVQSHDKYKKEVCDKENIKLLIIENLYNKFTETVGNDVWKEEIYWLMKELIPYCENK